MTHTTATPEETEFLSLLPGLEMRAHHRFRYPTPVDRDDAVADVIAYGFASYIRLKQRGKDPTAFPVAFATYVVRAVSNGRAIGREFSSRDVMSEQTQRRRGVTVHRFDEPMPDGSGWWRDMTADPRTNVADQAAFNVDFPAWVGTLPAVKQRVTRLLAHGHATDVTAELADLSASRVSQLRRELAKSWEMFHANH